MLIEIDNNAEVRVHTVVKDKSGRDIVVDTKLSYENLRIQDHLARHICFGLDAFIDQHNSKQALD